MAQLKSRDSGIVVPSFISAGEVRDTYQKRRDIRGIEEGSAPTCTEELPDLYPRDGFITLAKLERDLSRLIGIGQESLIAYPSGMSAVVAAVESANPTQGTTVLMGHDHYTEIPRYIDVHLRPRGVKVVRVDSGDPDAIDRAIERYSPEVILFETVANGTTMPVLDLEALFGSIARTSKNDPLVVLDNTLPTSTAVPISLLFGDGSVKVAVVESGTKSYAFNGEMLGILYTNRQELWRHLYSARITVGYTPALSAIDVIASRLPNSKEEFDERNNRIFENSLTLAQACALAASENPALTVVHPNLPGHQNYLLSQRLSPTGVSPVFYINNGTDQFELVDRLLEDPIICDYCEISQSFGFDRTRFYPYYGNQFVRIAGGIETRGEIEELATALTAALKRN